jgi:hypothetical protein
VARDNARKVWFAASQFFNGLVQADREAPVALRDRVHRIKAGPANNVEVRIPQARRVRVAIRHAPEWEAWAQVAHRRLREDRRVRAVQHAAQASRISPGKKKAR